MRGMLAWTAAFLQLFGCGWVMRLAWADHLASSDSSVDVARAAGLVPGHAAYLLQLADRLNLEQRDPIPALQAAAEACPRSPWPWIHLGISSEKKGDYRLAERRLFQAVRFSRDFEPRWALASYWFRRGAAGEFWHWMRASLDVADGDPVAAFDLCWRFTEDAAEIQSHGIPPRAPVLTAYFRYLLSRNRLKAAARLTDIVLQVPDLENTRNLLLFCTRALEAGEQEAALAAWNGLARAKRIPFRPLSPALSAVLTNGDFARRPSNAGFDWRVADEPGLAFTHSPGALRVEYERSRLQRELLSQYVPVAPGLTCTLRWQYHAADPAASFRWALVGTAGRVAATGPLQGGSLSFRVPPNERSCRLVLLQDPGGPPAGVVRAFELQRLDVECAP